MKLHKILMRHAGPKSQVEFTLQYVIADSEGQILARLDSKDGPFTFGGWAERCEFDEERHDEDERGPDGKRLLKIYDDNYKVIGHETFLDRMLRLRGEFNAADDQDWDDAYYGIKHYGWCEPMDVAQDDIDTLRRLGVKVEDWRDSPASGSAS